MEMLNNYEVKENQASLDNIFDKNEKVNTMKRKDINSDDILQYDDNLNLGYSQSSVKTDISVQEKLTELQEENRRLRKQLNLLDVSSTSKCQLLNNINVHGDKVCAIVKFTNLQNFMVYKDTFKACLSEVFHITMKEANLEIAVSERDKTVIKHIPKRHKNKTRKRKKSNSLENLFTLDTNPSHSNETNQNVSYVSKYSFIDAEKELTGIPQITCFNCDGNHTLRECSEPKNFIKIGIARSKLKSQQTKANRYHLEDEQKYATLTPGMISDKLRDALGLRKNELAPYIYRMRRCGYPPGWIEDAQIEKSNISLFDIDGKEHCAEADENKMIDPDKVIEYPVFNVPMEKGTRDDYKFYNSYPYSEKCSKRAMLEFLKTPQQKPVENNEIVDMDLDAGEEEVTNEIEESNPKCDNDRSSPSLDYLQKEQQKILAALNYDQIELNTDSLSNKLVIDLTDSQTELDVTTNSDVIIIDTDESTRYISNTLENNDVTSDSLIILDEYVLETSQIGNMNEKSKENGKMALENPEPELLLETGEKTGTEMKSTTADVGSIPDVKLVTVKEQHVSSESNVNNDEHNKCTSEKNDNILKSSYGTPIVRSKSTFNQLPERDNFSKDISPLLKFENLPNSTGKYDQMIGILKKIRETLHHDKS